MNVILFIVFLGGLYFMWDVLFNASLKSYKNPFGRRALFTVIGIIIFSLSSFFIGYAYSLFFDGNFMFAAMIDTFLKPLGWRFIASPLTNMILELFLPLIMLIYLALLENHRLKKMPIELEIKGDLVVLGGNDTKIEVDKKMTFQIIRFNVFLMIYIQLLLFRLFAYPNFNPLTFNAVLVVAGILLLLYALLALIGLKNIAIEGAIQSIFFSTGNEEVLTLFEFALRDEKIILEPEQLTPIVEEFILMGIFETSQTMKKTIFPDAQKARIIISEGNLSLYQKYKIRAIRRSESPKSYKKYKTTHRIILPYINPKLVKSNQF